MVVLSGKSCHDIALAVLKLAFIISFDSLEMCSIRVLLLSNVVHARVYVCSDFDLIPILFKYQNLN